MLCQALNSNSTGNYLSENAGFIVFKDRAVIVFYCNDLASAPSKQVRKHTDEFAIQCVHGLALLPRWIGDESLYRINASIPAVVVAYNKTCS